MSEREHPRAAPRARAGGGGLSSQGAPAAPSRKAPEPAARKLNQAIAQDANEEPATERHGQQTRAFEAWRSHRSAPPQTRS